MKCTFAVALLSWLASGAATRQDKEILLSKEVFENRSVFAEIDARSTKLFNITFTFYPLFILGLDEQAQVLRSSGWIDFEWIDHRLTWDESLYDGIDKVHVKRKNIWIPDLQVENSVKDLAILGSKEEFVIVYSDGSVEWSPGDIYETICEVDVAKFPFDSQECYLNVSTWMYYSHEIRLTPGDDPIKLNFYKGNSEWQLMSITFDENKFIFDEEGSVQDAISFNFKLKRHSAFYILKIIIPTVILSVLNSFVFIVPPESGEKVSMSVTTMLSLTVFLSYIGDVTPNNSERIPYIALFVVLHLALGALSIVCNIVTLDMHYRAKNRKHRKKSTLDKEEYGDVFPSLCTMLPGIKAIAQFKNVNKTRQDTNKKEYNAKDSVLNKTPDIDVDEVHRTRRAMKIMRYLDFGFFVFFLLLSISVTLGCVIMMLN